MRVFSAHRALLPSLLLPLAWIAAHQATAGPPDSLAVVNLKTLAADMIHCERIALGEPDDYKPCIAQLPSGELLLTAYHQHRQDEGRICEQNLLFRSRDGGRTWSDPQELDLLGREPYLTVLIDGTVFIHRA